MTDQLAVTKGLLVTIEAEPGRESDLEARLRSSLAAVQQEPDTIAWLALRLGPTSFAVVDVFPDDAGRQFHLDAGKARLADEALRDMLASTPSFTITDVVAAKSRPPHPKWPRPDSRPPQPTWPRPSSRPLHRKRP